MKKLLLLSLSLTLVSGCLNAHYKSATADMRVTKFMTNGKITSAKFVDGNNTVLVIGFSSKVDAASVEAAFKGLAEGAVKGVKGF